ncbi:MAG TPA: SPOR domain-containing protein [Steroidobacteraceae bacterium]
MESRAKQRLTGAIILVALFVLLVPELLTGPRDSHPGTDSPSGEGMRRYTIDLDAHNSAGQSAAPAGNQAPVALPEVVPAPAASTERAVPGEAASAPFQADATNPAPAPNKPAAAAPAAVAATPKPTPTPAVAAAPAPAETSRAAPTNPPRGSFVVQLGSFGSKENAERLVRDMTAKGFTTFIAPITTNGRELYRVRVGPTRDRASAEALAAQLKRIGQSGSIVPIS